MLIEITNTEDNQISNNLNITRSSRTSDEEKMIMKYVLVINFKCMSYSFFNSLSLIF